MESAGAPRTEPGGAESSGIAHGVWQSGFTSQSRQTQYFYQDHMEILTKEAPLPSRIVSWLLLVLLMTGAGAVFGQTVEEYDLKAAFLYNFTKFIEWPPASLASGAFIIGIFGEDPFGSAIEDVTRGKSVSGHEIQIRRLKEPAEARNCNMIFVTSTDRRKIQELLEATKRSAILTVGENKEFLNQGGTIYFSMANNRVGIVINNAAAADKGLKVSAKLLSLAKIYEKD